MSGRSRWRRFGIAVGALALLDAAVLVAWDAWVQGFADAHVVRDPRQLATHDAAVVFFGALDRAGNLDAGTARRIHDAASLLRAQRVRAIIAVGGDRTAWERSGSALMADALVAQGVPAGDVLHDSSSYDSVTNWREATAIAAANGFTRLVLVSTPSHLARLATIVGARHPPAAYFSTGAPALTPWTWWVSAHRELASLLALRILPREWYVVLMQRMRQGGARW